MGIDHDPFIPQNFEISIYVSKFSKFNNIFALKDLILDFLEILDLLG